MKDWQKIRHARIDLTDFVMHLTKDGGDPYVDAKDRLKNILKRGYILPSFAPLANRYSNGKTRPTIKGPWPAVCLTEQPLWALVEMENLSLWNKRYSSYGIAFHKSYLHLCGARPAIYGDESMLGRLAPEKHKAYEKGKEVYIEGLDPKYQYLWTRYSPALPDDTEHPIDFTWEREWRYKVKVVEDDDRPGLEVPLRFGGKRGAIVVRYDEDIPEFQKLIRRLGKKRKGLLKMEHRIVSLETAETKLAEGEQEYGRLDTWPDFED